MTESCAFSFDKKNNFAALSTVHCPLSIRWRWNEIIIKLKWQSTCIRAYFFFSSSQIAQDTCECIEYRVIIIVITTCTQWKAMHSWLFLICSFTIFIFSHAAKIRMFILFDLIFAGTPGTISSIHLVCSQPHLSFVNWNTPPPYPTSKPYWQFFADANKQCTKPKPNWKYLCVIAGCAMLYLQVGFGCWIRHFFYEFNVCTGSVFS